MVLEALELGLGGQGVLAKEKDRQDIFRIERVWIRKQWEKKLDNKIKARSHRCHGRL